LSSALPCPRAHELTALWTAFRRLQVLNVDHFAAVHVLSEHSIDQVLSTAEELTLIRGPVEFSEIRAALQEDRDAA